MNNLLFNILKEEKKFKSLFDELTRDEKENNFISKIEVNQKILLKDRNINNSFFYKKIQENLKNLKNLKNEKLNNIFYNKIKKNNEELKKELYIKNSIFYKKIYMNICKLKSQEKNIFEELIEKRIKQLKRVDSIFEKRIKNNIKNNLKFIIKVSKTKEDYFENLIYASNFTLINDSKISSDINNSYSKKIESNFTLKNDSKISSDINNSYSKKIEANFYRLLNRDLSKDELIEDVLSFSRKEIKLVVLEPNPAEIRKKVLNKIKTDSFEKIEIKEVPLQKWVDEDPVLGELVDQIKYIKKLKNELKYKKDMNKEKISQIERLLYKNIKIIEGK